MSGGSHVKLWQYGSRIGQVNSRKTTLKYFNKVKCGFVHKGHEKYIVDAAYPFKY
jgi:hypothetical protein